MRSYLFTLHLHTRSGEWNILFIRCSFVTKGISLIFLPITRKCPQIILLNAETYLNIIFSIRVQTACISSTSKKVLGCIIANSSWNLSPEISRFHQYKSYSIWTNVFNSIRNNWFAIIFLLRLYVFDLFILFVLLIPSVFYWYERVL